MGKFSDRDPEYLRNVQYGNAQRLQTRGSIHDRFSTNAVGWHRWLFDLILERTSEATVDVVDLGAGTGALWRQNSARIPRRWKLRITDFSKGMMETATAALGASGVDAQCSIVDVQTVPFADASFDLVLANHMLYHVPDRSRALSRPTTRSRACSGTSTKKWRVITTSGFTRMPGPSSHSERDESSRSRRDGTSLLSRPMPQSDREIENLIYAYAEHIDAGDLVAVAELFRHGRIEAAPGIMIEGTEEVRRLYDSSTRLYENGTPRTRHVTTNVAIEVDDEAGTASARAYFTVFQQTDELPLQPIIAGHYHDSFHQVDGRWCFNTRQMFVDLTGDLSHHLLFELR